jgi:hypothetical protein
VCVSRVKSGVAGLCPRSRFQAPRIGVLGSWLSRSLRVLADLPIQDL